MIRASLTLAGSALLAVSAVAQQAGAQNAAPPPFAPPPPVYTPTADERAQLDAKEKALEERVKALAGKNDPHLPDAAVFLHVARISDQLQSYTGKGNVTTVLRGLDVGLERCEQLAHGQAPWLTQPGKTLRGYVSRVDGSLQPYGVVLPAAFNAKTSAANRLDVVLHGRGPTEITFMNGFLPSATNKAPDVPFIEVHPFGRANNGWRWSGETDVFEALDQAKALYKVDPNRTILRGFSMGGHGAWQIGVHYAGMWAAVSPGAGFTETRNYIKAKNPLPYQEQGWHIYDAVDYALNLFDTPFIAYGGEDDPQLQASLNMKAAAEGEGLPFNLIVGPHTKHAYEPNSLKEIMRQLATHTREPEPKQLKFTTWTTKYNRMKWLTVDALGAHYQRARVDAQVNGPVVTLKTQNVAALTLDPVPSGVTRAEIDGKSLPVAGPRFHLERGAAGWTTRTALTGLRKTHNLQGPIDDAFMERFVVVRGTGTPWSEAAGKYAAQALTRFQDDWRFGFRGEAPVMDDTAATDKDWADANLILFGDPGSNKVLARVVEKLPLLKWTKTGVDVGGKHYGANHVPVLIYPNPLNPKRYVVINSGQTFTRADLNASNANLFPKLPDWAVLKVDGNAPEVAAADYFDETWHVKR